MCSTCEALSSVLLREKGEREGGTEREEREKGRGEACNINRNGFVKEVLDSTLPSYFVILAKSSFLGLSFPLGNGNNHAEFF